MVSTRQAFSFLVSVLACTVIGCAPAPPPPAPAPAVPAANAAAKLELAATINGQPVPMGELHELLVAAYGYNALAQLSATSLVRQEAEREGIHVSAQDVESETLLTLRELDPDLTAAQEQVLLAQLLQQKQIPRAYWDMAMWRNAVLRKIAAKQLKITDEMLTNQFNRQYGLKVVIRHIRCASLSDAQNIVDRIEKGEDFGELARKYSTYTQTAAQGGLLRAFSRDDTDTVPAHILKQAFDLEDGKVSGVIAVDDDFHIIKREKSIPPKNVDVNEIKPQLRRQILDNHVRKARTQLLDQMRRQADMVILHPVLKQQAEAQGPGQP